MQDTGHFNPNFLGGQFRWWVGQVAPAKHWKGNSTKQLEKKAKRIPGWGYRYKVRIIGLHDRDEAVLPSEQLPWAQVMYGVTDGGGQRGQLTTPAIAQGNFVFGFFLDGDEEQVPIIMGILGHNQKTKIKTTEVVNYGASCAWDDQDVIAGDSTILGNKDNYKSEDNNNEEDDNNDTTNTDGQGGESGEVSNVIRQGVDATDLVTSGDNKQKDILTKKHFVDCAVKGQKPEMKGIQLAIKNMSKDIAKAQKALNDFPTAISIPIVKLETEIDDIVNKYTGDISKHMNTVLNKVEHFSLESLTNKLIDKIAEAPSGDAKKLSKEQLQRRKTLACVLGKTKGQLGNLIKAGIGRMLARRKNRSGGGENQLVGNGSNLIPPVAPDGYYYPSNPCETEEFVSEIMADTLGTMFETMNQTQETTVGSVGSSTLDGSSGGRGLLGSITDLGQGVSGALGKLNSLSNLSVGSLLPLGALGGPLANLSGSLNKLSGFGALDPTNFDVALAMSFVSVIGAFSECIPKPSCSENDATTLDGGGESEKDEINAANVSKDLNDKVSPSNKSVFDNLTEGQKNRILNAPIGTNVEGVNVDEKIKFELRQYEMSNGEERFPILSDTSNDTSNVTANNQPPESFSEFRNRTGNVEQKTEPVETPTFNKPETSNNLDKRIDELATSSWATEELKNVAKSGNGTVNLRSNGNIALDANTKARIDEHSRIVKEINSIEGTLQFRAEVDPNQTIQAGNNVPQNLQQTIATDAQVEQDKKKLLNLTKQLAYIEGGGAVRTNDRAEVEAWKKLKYELEE